MKGSKILLIAALVALPGLACANPKPQTPEMGESKALKAQIQQLTSKIHAEQDKVAAIKAEIEADREKLKDLKGHAKTVREKIKADRAAAKAAPVAVPAPAPEVGAE